MHAIAFSLVMPLYIAVKFESMADRPMILARCNEDFELTLAALLYLWRNTNKAPAPYSTAIGQGYNSKQQGLDAITSFALACILNDPKNTTKLVPAVGNMEILPRGTGITKQYEPGTHALMSNRDHIVLMDSVPAPFVGITVFRMMTHMAEYIAYYWGSEGHKKLRQYFRLTIQVSPHIMATMDWEPDEESPNQNRSFQFFPKSKKRAAMPKRTIPSRNVVITVDHIEMIADLYRDTLAHEAAAKEPDPQPSLTLDEGSDVPKPENENAGLAGPASTRKSRTTAKQSRGITNSQIKTESDFAQPCRAAGLFTSHP